MLVDGDHEAGGAHGVADVVDLGVAGRRQDLLHHGGDVQVAHLVPADN